MIPATDRDMLHDFIQEEGVVVTGKGILRRLGKGTIQLGSETLRDVLLVENLQRRLISGRKLLKDTTDRIVLKAAEGYLQRNGKIVQKYSVIDDLYVLDTSHIHDYAYLTGDDERQLDINEWHQRLGHIGYKTLQRMGCSGSLKPCSVCAKSKKKRRDHKRRHVYSNIPLQTIH